ncbi:metallophosphoesterase [Arthrobacter sp. Soc17.1.1.1]|uniref:metallophosphoesterase family protein n=1 Tax=Arthrobacter sp. Soc17.1.1.1 TaxID=3121277 RepID=UPI002FE4853C
MELSNPLLAVFGDWHGHLGWALGAIDAAERAGVRTLLHVGDFGLDFPGPQRGRYESKLSRRLAASDMRILISPGNHDNWSTILKLPVGEDGTAQFTEQVLILPRGGRTTIESVVIGGLGGAYSVDQGWRKTGKDWWPNEEPTQEEAEHLIAGGPVKVLLTHDVPASVPMKGEFDLPPHIADRAEQTRRLLDSVVERLQPPVMFCGHWHHRRQHSIPHAEGTETRVHVLGKELNREGNAVLLIPTNTGSLVAEPLFVVGR